MQHYVDSLGAQYNEDKSVLGSIPKGLERYEIIEGCTVLSATALENGESLKELILPASFQILALGDFDHCPNLERLVIRSEGLVTVKPLDRGKHFQTIDFADFFNQYPHIKEIYVPEVVKADYSTLLKPVVKSIEEYGIAKNNNAEKYHWYYDFLFYPEQEDFFPSYIKVMLFDNIYCTVSVYEYRCPNSSNKRTFVNKLSAQRGIIKENVSANRTTLEYNQDDIVKVEITWTNDYPHTIIVYRNNPFKGCAYIIDVPSGEYIINKYVNSIFPDKFVSEYIPQNWKSQFSHLRMNNVEDINDLREIFLSPIRSLYFEDYIKNYKSQGELSEQEYSKQFSCNFQLKSSFFSRILLRFMDLYVNNMNTKGKISKQEYTEIKGLILDLEAILQLVIEKTNPYWQASHVWDGELRFLKLKNDLLEYGYGLLSIKRIYFLYHILNHILYDNKEYEEGCKGHFGWKYDWVNLVEFNKVSFIDIYNRSFLSSLNEQISSSSSLRDCEYMQNGTMLLGMHLINRILGCDRYRLCNNYAGRMIVYCGFDPYDYLRFSISDFEQYISEKIDKSQGLVSQLKDLVEFYSPAKKERKEHLFPISEKSIPMQERDEKEIVSSKKTGCMLLLSSIFVILLTIFL